MRKEYTPEEVVSIRGIRTREILDVIKTEVANVMIAAECPTGYALVIPQSDGSVIIITYGDKLDSDKSQAAVVQDK